MRCFVYFLILFAASLSGCSVISKKTPVCFKKPPVVYRSYAAATASDFFWDTFQTANYAQSDQALDLLMQASSADPADDHLIELVGLCSFWKVVEHGRGYQDSRSLVPLAAQSLVYVEEAQRREPQNRLVPGFVSSARYQLGAMQCDPQAMSQAICELQQNTAVYPQFHGFVEGWVLTAMLRPDHPAYQKAVDAYFETLDSCAGIRIPRFFPKIGPIGLYVLAKKSATETVCYNTNIAPHNVEGTLLGLGDALLKQGKKREARIVYESIPNIPAYKCWPFKDVLQQRLDNMDCLQRKFVADSGCTDVAEPAMLFQSTIACTSCHATLSPTMRYTASRAGAACGAR